MQSLSQHCRLGEHATCPRETTLGTSACLCACHAAAWVVSSNGAALKTHHYGHLPRYARHCAMRQAIEWKQAYPDRRVVIEPHTYDRERGYVRAGEPVEVTGYEVPEPFHYERPIGAGFHPYLRERDWR